MTLKGYPIRHSGLDPENVRENQKVIRFRMIDKIN